MRRFALLLLVALGASCNGDSEVGTIEIDLFDAPVSCDEGADCLDEWGETAAEEPLHGFAFVSTETSAYQPNGLYVYFEVARPDGAVGRGELDVPLRGDAEIQVSYEERTGDEVTFVAEEAVGIVEVPEEAYGESCECLDGRLELVLRSAEGEERRLSRGRFGWGDQPCVSRARFTHLGEELTVLPRSCGVDPAPSTPRYDPPPSTGDTYYTPPASYGSGCDTSGCNSSSSSSASCNGSGGGCGGSGGGGGCNGGGSGGGCEGDTGGAGGCSGDTGGAGGCAGDSGGCRVVRGPRRVGPQGPLQTGLLVALALLWSLRPRRHR